MKTSKNQQKPGQTGSPNEPETELGSLRSVRTTFKLSRGSSDALATLKARHGLGYKVIIDAVVGVFNPDPEGSNQKMSLWESLARAASPDEGSRTVRKTYVISKQSMQTLTKVAKQYKVPRDALLDMAIDTYWHIHEKRAQALKEKYEKAFKMLSDFWGQAEKIEGKLESMLPENDPILGRFGEIVIHIMNLHGDIEGNLKDGSPINNW